MHDASEAYLLDIPSPVKKKLQNYSEIEDRLMMLIAQKFGFSYPLNQDVKDADKLMLEMEWNSLMISKNTQFYCQTNDEAKQSFLESFRLIETFETNRLAATM